MQRSGTALLNALLVLSLLLSGLVFSAPGTRGTASAPTTLSSEVSPEPASRKVKRERKHDRKQKDRKQDRTKKDRKADRKQTDKKQDRKKARQAARTKGNRESEPVATEPGRVGNWEEKCAAPGAIRLKGSQLCTHGPDPVPAGFNVDQPVALDADQAAGPASASFACQSDGADGFRVQLLYVHGPTPTQTLSQVRPLIQGWAGEMDQIFADNAAAGSPRSLRFVHDLTSPCQPVVDDVHVTTAGLLDFDRMIAELEDQGYNRSDRIYLSFVDTTDAGICGIGTLWGDDEKDGTRNWNNVGPSYSRVDAGCWSGWIAAHEVMHNLGGVQLSAPHTSGGFHCIDEFDIMCYSDTPNRPTMDEVCTPEVPLDTTLLDCNHDDYYNTNPAGGSYLANFWNTANNRFLIGAPATGLPDDYTNPTVEWVTPVGNDGTVDVSAGTVNLEADPDDAGGVAVVEFWRWDNEDDDWVLLGEDVAEPYTSSVAVSALSMGENIISADVYDTTGRWVDEWIYVNRVNTPPPPPAPTLDTAPVGDPSQSPPTNDKKKKKKKGKGKGKKKR